MRKYYIAFVLLVLVGVMLFMAECVRLSDVEEVPRKPASVSNYQIESIANEVGLIKLYPESNTSDCGLTDKDFIKYVKERIDYRRKFQFVVFERGRTMTGKYCIKKAFIYYLK